MKKRTLLRLAALLPIVLTILAACQKDLDTGALRDPADVCDSVWTLTLDATKAEIGTKALYQNTGDPGSLSAYWGDSEKVTVYKEGSCLGTLNVSPVEGTMRNAATLSGTITVSGIAQGDALTLLIPRENWAYTGQVGTLDSIQDNFDYATATVTVRTVDPANYVITTTGAIFRNEQSIYRFGFKVGESYFDPKDFTVSAAGGKLVTYRTLSGSAWTPAYGGITVTPAAAPGDHLFYVSLRNDQTTEDTYSFIITGSDDALYMATKNIPAEVLDAPGKFISAKSISATQPNFTAESGTTDTAL